jgi:RNA polymerase sigma factor (TIGR02999 family)
VEPASSSITRLLQQSHEGNKAAFDELVPMVYDHLHRLASRRLSAERSGHTLRTTEIVNEAYLRLVEADVAWSNREHFYAIAAQVMRRILIDYAKGRTREKRGGAYEKVPLDAAYEVGADSGSNLLEVNQALERLAKVDARKATIVELLVFGGLTYDEAAAAIGISPATLHRELRLAKAFLHRELTAVRSVAPEAAGGGGP